MSLTIQQIHDGRQLRRALDLIRGHMTAADTAQNRDLHRAISLILDVARHHHLLDPEWGARLYRELVESSPYEYACDACASDIDQGGITEDAGRTGNFYALCSLSGAPATHEVIDQEVK